MISVLLILSKGCLSRSIEGQGGEGLYQGRIIDSHAHFSAGRIDIDWLISILDRAQVSQVVLFAGKKDLQAAYQKYPDRIIPFLSPYGIYRRSGQMKIPQRSLPEIKKSLGSGFFRGYGEVLLRLHPLKFIAPDGVNIPADDPVMLKIYDSAAEHGLPVNLHVDAPYSKELGKALGHNRKTKIIWAHCGYADASLIRSMFEKHPNLFADISVLADPYKKHSVDMTGSDGTLKQEWKNLFEDFSHRLMLGSDMGKSKDRYMMTPKIMRHYRRLLFQLSQESAEDIAYKTILGLIRHDE